MFVPFVFFLRAGASRYETFLFWHHFYWSAGYCIEKKWPIIAHEHFFDIAYAEETVFGMPLQAVASEFDIDITIPDAQDMLSLKSYPLPWSKEESLIAKYNSHFDCCVDLLKNENAELEQIILELLDKIICDFGEKPEGILVWEQLPKALKSAAEKRGIPIVFRCGTLVRPLLQRQNYLNLVNDDSAKLVKSKYDRFMCENKNVPMLSRKGLLRLLVSENYMMAIHNIDNEPEYDVGVLYNNMDNAAFHITQQEYFSDEEMSARAKKIYERVLIRTRPGFEATANALDDSPTSFHFCCKCKRVLGNTTKGVFDAMLAGRIAHEYGSCYFHSFCNDGIEDDSKKIVPIEFINFVLFGLCTSYDGLTDPEYLRFLLSKPSEKQLYMRSFEHSTREVSREDIEFYYMPGNPDRAYRLGDPLYFTSGHKPHEYGTYYCTGGLQNWITENGTWSNGERTSFEFDLVESVNEPLIVTVLLYDIAMNWDLPNPSQILSCEANGVDLCSVTLSKTKELLRFTIPAECFTNKLRITFSYSYLRDDGYGKSAVVFEQMYISRLEQKIVFSEIFEIITHMEEQIESIHNSRRWKLGSALVNAARKFIPYKKKRK